MDNYEEQIKKSKTFEEQIISNPLEITQEKKEDLMRPKEDVIPEKSKQMDGISSYDIFNDKMNKALAAEKNKESLFGFENMNKEAFVSQVSARDYQSQMCDFLVRLVNLRSKLSSSYYNDVVRGIETLTKRNYEADTPEYKKAYDAVSTYIKNRDDYKITTNGGLRLTLIKEIRDVLNEKLQSTAKLHTEETRRLDGVKVTEQALEGKLNAYMTQNFYEKAIRLKLSARDKGDAPEFNKTLKSIDSLIEGDFDSNDFTMVACESRQIAYDDCCKYLEKHQENKSSLDRERFAIIEALRDELKSMIPELGLSDHDKTVWAARQAIVDQMVDINTCYGKDIEEKEPVSEKMKANVKAFWTHTKLCNNSINYFKKTEGLDAKKSASELFWGDFSRKHFFVLHGFACDPEGNPMTELDKKYRDEDYRILKIIYDEQRAIDKIRRKERMSEAKKFNKRYVYFSRILKYYNVSSKLVVDEKMDFDDLVDGVHDRHMYLTAFFDSDGQTDNFRSDDPYFMTYGTTAEDKKWISAFDRSDECNVIPFVTEKTEDFDEGLNEYWVSSSVPVSGIKIVVTTFVEHYSGIDLNHNIMMDYKNECYRKAGKRQIFYMNCSKPYFEKKAKFLAGGYKGGVPSLLVYQEIFKKLKKGAGSGFKEIITAIERHEAVLDEMTPEKVSAAKALTPEISKMAKDYIERHEDDENETERVELMTGLIDSIKSFKPVYEKMEQVPIMRRFNELAGFDIEKARSTYEENTNIIEAKKNKTYVEKKYGKGKGSFADSIFSNIYDKNTKEENEEIEKQLDALYGNDEEARTKAVTDLFNEVADFYDETEFKNLTISECAANYSKYFRMAQIIAAFDSIREEYPQTYEKVFAAGSKREKQLNKIKPGMDMLAQVMAAIEDIFEKTKGEKGYKNISEDDFTMLANKAKLKLSNLKSM